MHSSEGRLEILSMKSETKWFKVWIIFLNLCPNQDCMEEMNLFSENKTHLKQIGEQLITASNKTKEAEVNDKLKDVNDRWQHLFDHIEAR